MIITVLCLAFCDTALVLSVMVAATLCAGIAMLIRRTRYTVVTASLIGVAFSCILLLSAQYRYNTATASCEKLCTVEAVVTESAEFSRENGRYYAVATVKTVDGEKSYGKIRLSFSETDDGINPQDIISGNSLSFTAFVYRIGGDNEKVRNNFLSRNIFLGAYSIGGLNVSTPVFRPLNYYAELIRDKISDTLNFYFTDDKAGFLIAILTGDTDECSDAVYDSIRKSGAAHILAVSGLHLSIWVSVILFCLERIRRLKRMKYILMVPFLVFMVYIAQFSASVRRAALMTFLYFIGATMRKNVDSLNSLGFAAVVMLFVNPYVVYSLSFQLSFTCVLSLLIMAIPLSEWIKKKLGKLKIHNQFIKAVQSAAATVIFSLTVGFFTFPICADSFGNFSVLAPITNLFLIPACAPTMVLSTLFVIFSRVPVLSDILYILTNVISGYMLSVAEKISESSFATLRSDSDVWLIWFVTVLSVIFIAFLAKVARRYYATVLSFVLVIFLCFSYLNTIERNAEQYRMRIISDTSDSGVLLIQNNKAVLIGTGNYYGFGIELEHVLQAENADLVAYMPEPFIDDVTISCICADYEIEYVIGAGESVVLFDETQVRNTGKTAVVTGNGRIIQIIYTDYLQEDITCDIIIGNDGTVCDTDGAIICRSTAEEIQTVCVSSESDITVGGEKVWLNLTKRN